MKKYILIALIATSFARPAFADVPHCTTRALTFVQAQQAIREGGAGIGLQLGTRNPATGNFEISPNGDAVVRNDTDCPVSLSVASYTLNNPSDPELRSQTFYAATPKNTYIAAHSTQTLHVNVPPCNFQADFFYGDSYDTSNGDRYVKSPYFLDAGYVVNRALAGGTPCPAPAPSPVPQPTPTPTPAPTPSPVPPPSSPTSPPPTYYPPYYPPPYYSSPPTYYYPPQQPPQIIQTTYQVQPQMVQLPEYVPLTEIPYTGLSDYPLLPLYATAFVFWAVVISLFLLKRMFKNRVLRTK